MASTKWENQGQIRGRLWQLFVDRIYNGLSSILPASQTIEKGFKSGFRAPSVIGVYFERDGTEGRSATHGRLAERVITNYPCVAMQEHG